jgi:hypothetical protein
MIELEHIESFKKENKENMAKLIATHGHLPPVCTVFTVKNDKHSVVLAPVPEEAVQNEENKKTFLKIMPLFFKKLEEDGHKIICFSYSSEAWLRKADIEGGVPEDWKSMPKTEVLISSYETSDTASVEIHDIIREGKIANEDGELIDCIRLEKNADMGDSEKGELGGRFSRMYRDFLESQNVKTE